ncbi:envelope integrity protein Cei [Bounagaea algeriensis]
MSAVSSKWGQRGPRYRRRRPLPGLVLLAVLAVLAGFLWTRVFESVENIDQATQCNAPNLSGEPPSDQQAEGRAQSGAVAHAAEAGTKQQVPGLGTMMPREALDRTTPLPPGEGQLRVLNGNGESQQASLVTDQLTTLGFDTWGQPGDDPVYPEYNLTCHGQIRYGEGGERAARTLSLVVPCAQLVRTERSDGRVEFALGSEFDDVQTTQQGKQVLQELQNWVPSEHGGDPPRIDPELLEKARDVHC